MLATSMYPWFGLVWSGLVWSGLVWSGLGWSGLVWAGKAATPFAHLWTIEDGKITKLVQYADTHLASARDRQVARSPEPKQEPRVKGSSNGGTYMPESNRPLVERIARVLAGAAHSSNAEGADPSAGEKVDKVWREHMNQALAVLHTMREPDEEMAAAGDSDVWRKMIGAAISERVD